MSAKLKEPGRLLPDMTEVYVSEASAMERVFDSFIKDCGLSDLSQMNTLLEKINLLSQRMAKLGTCEIAPHSLQRRCSSVRNDKEVLKRRNIDLAAMDREMEALSCGIHSHSEDLKRISKFPQLCKEVKSVDISILSDAAKSFDSVSSSSGACSSPLPEYYDPVEVEKVRSETALLRTKLADLEERLSRFGGLDTV
uniref:Protein MIS12 homolog n=1 Tax=Mesocestoides corti TaxID=53468 RepID=A0A5K3FE26_MESCO